MHQLDAKDAEGVLKGFSVLDGALREVIEAIDGRVAADKTFSKSQVKS